MKRQGAAAENGNADPNAEVLRQYGSALLELVLFINETQRNPVAVTAAGCLYTTAGSSPQPSKPQYLTLQLKCAMPLGMAVGSLDNGTLVVTRLVDDSTAQVSIPSAAVLLCSLLLYCCARCCCTAVLAAAVLLCSLLYCYLVAVIITTAVSTAAVLLYCCTSCCNTACCYCCTRVAA